MYDERKITARFDLQKVKTVNEVNLGDTVSVLVRGKVTSMRGPEESLHKDSKGKEHKSTYPGTLEVEIAKIEISADGEFDGMGDD